MILPLEEIVENSPKTPCFGTVVELETGCRDSISVEWIEKTVFAKAEHIFLDYLSIGLIIPAVEENGR